MSDTREQVREVVVPPETLDVARRWRAAFEAAFPDAVTRPRRPGHVRGIDVYPSEPTLMRAMAIGLSMYAHRHGRLPGPERITALAEAVFVEKFYGQFPMKPNPADKLNAELWLPEALRDTVQVAERPWVADAPGLPPDEAVPEGAWILKLALGNATNERLTWPPSPEERARLDALSQRWVKGRYGVIWGEWWYGIGGQRLFLEQDLTEARAGQPEFKLYTRGGRVKAIRAVRHRKEQRLPTAECFFDATFAPMEGQSEGYDPVTMAPPRSAENMIRAAEGIGRSFDRVRVDFLDTGAERPWLNEVTLGDVNAQRRVTPAALDRTLLRLLFG